MNGIKLVIRKKQVRRAEINRTEAGNWKYIIQQQYMKGKREDKNELLRPSS